MKVGDLVKWNYPNSTDPDAPTIGVIGGTGLYEIDGFENAHPCGACSERPSRPTTPGA